MPLRVDREPLLLLVPVKLFLVLLVRHKLADRCLVGGRVELEELSGRLGGLEHDLLELGADVLEALLVQAVLLTLEMVDPLGL